MLAAASSSGKSKGKSASTKGAGSALPQSVKDSRLASLSEMLGEDASASRATLLKYLEAASWSIEVAACNIMDSTWFKSSHTAEAAAGSVAAASSIATATAAASSHRSHDMIDISDDDDTDALAAASSSAKRKLPPCSSSSAAAAAAAGSKKPRSASTLDAFARVKSEEDAEDDEGSNAVGAFSSSAPAPIMPSWDRKLLLILNVAATSTTSGTALKVGDALEFRREPFDMDAWAEKQRVLAEERRADAVANAQAMAAASAPTAGGKKKPAAGARQKSKSALLTAAASKKRAPRVLRFTKKGASASHLELGSVPHELSVFLAPLFDSGCIELESEVMWLPAKLEPFDTLRLSLSVFVLPALFMFRPSMAALASVPSPSDNPFFRKGLAKKENPNTHAWNPVDNFVRMLKECGLRPIASVEAEIDQQQQQQQQQTAASETPAAAAAKPEPIQVLDADTEMKESTNEDGASAGVFAATSASASSSAAAAAASSSSSSSAAAAAAAASPSLLADAALGDEGDGVDNNEGASVSRFQLDALYAGAAAACVVIPEADAPPELRTTLRAYQRQALHWMMAREAGDEARQDTSNEEAAPGQQPARRRHPVSLSKASAALFESRSRCSLSSMLLLCACGFSCGMPTLSAIPKKHRSTSTHSVRNARSSFQSRLEVAAEGQQSHARSRVLSPRIGLKLTSVFFCSVCFLPPFQSAV